MPAIAVLFDPSKGASDATSLATWLAGPHSPSGMGRHRVFHGGVRGCRRGVLLQVGRARDHARVVLSLPLLRRGIAGGLTRKLPIRGTFAFDAICRSKTADPL